MLLVVVMELPAAMGPAALCTGYSATLNNRALNGTRHFHTPLTDRLFQYFIGRFCISSLKPALEFVM
jgi:hypothetical protein